MYHGEITYRLDKKHTQTFLVSMRPVHLFRCTTLPEAVDSPLVKALENHVQYMEKKNMDSGSMK